MANRFERNTGLPHGSVSPLGVTDAQTRDVLMRLNENIVALSKIKAGFVRSPSAATIDAEKLLKSIEENYPNAAAAMEAVQQVAAAASAASESAAAASGSAIAAAGSAREAANHASDASRSASAADASASVVGQYAWSAVATLATYNALTYKGSGVNTFDLGLFVPDKNESYDVTAIFYRMNSSVSSAIFKISTDSSNETSENTASSGMVSVGPGSPQTLTLRNVSGDSSLYVLNGGSSSSAAKGSQYFSVCLKIEKAANDAGTE